MSRRDWRIPKADRSSELANSEELATVAPLVPRSARNGQLLNSPYALITGPVPDNVPPELAGLYTLEDRRAQVRELVEHNRSHQRATTDEIEKLRAQMVTRAKINLAGLAPVIDGYVYENSLFRVIGAPGSLKSFVVLDMAAAIAEGRPWHGNLTKPGPVIIVAAEGSDGIGKRMAAWEAVNGRTFPEGVGVFPMPIQLKSSAWSALIEICREWRPVLVVGDTQARLTAGVNENAATDMGLVVARLDEMREATGAAVGLVHHSTKDGAAGGRGSNSVEGALQSEITVTKSGPPRLEVATIRSTRQKDDARADDLALQTRFVELGTDERGRELNSLAFEQADVFAMPAPAGTPVRERILAAMAESFSERAGTPTAIRAVVTEQGGKVPNSTWFKAWGAVRAEADSPILRDHSREAYIYAPARLDYATRPSAL